MARFSGLQKDVLALYRDCMRAAYRKPTQYRKHWVDFIHAEFGKHRQVSRRDFATVEYLLRSGRRRYEMYGGDDTTDVM